MKFTNKLNKIDGNIYTVEEELIISNNKYEGTLAHDNINHATLVVYGGKGLTGDKIDNYVISKLEGQEWKTFIEVYHNSNVYVTYETEGDVVEAEDINLLQDEIIKINSILEGGIGGDYDEVIQSLKDKDIELEKSIDSKIAQLVDSSPSTLDTLKEIAEALGNDPNFATTITNELSLKANTSYVDTELSKKSNVHSHPYKDINYIPSWNEVTNKPSEFVPSSHGHSYLELTDKPNIPVVDVTKLYVDGELAKKSDTHTHPYKSDSYIPSWSEITGKPTIPIVDVTKSYVDEKLSLKSDVHSHPYKSNTYVPNWTEVTGKPTNATQSASGFMSELDKIKLDGIQNNANYFSGSYNDLTNKPTMPVVDVTKSYVDSELLKKSDIHTHPYRLDTWLPPNDHSHSNKTELDKIVTGKVAYWDSKSNFSGSYNDLTNKPTIPIVDVNKSYVDTELAKKSNIHTHPYRPDTWVPDNDHSHTNKSVIDGITSTKITEWNNKSTFSGNYSDLSNKPTIPTKLSQLENDIGVGGLPSQFTWSMLRGY